MADSPIEGVICKHCVATTWQHAQSVPFDGGAYWANPSIQCCWNLMTYVRTQDRTRNTCMTFSHSPKLTMLHSLSFQQKMTIDDNSQYKMFLHFEQYVYFFQGEYIQNLLIAMHMIVPESVVNINVCSWHNEAGCHCIYYKCLWLAFMSRSKSHTWHVEQRRYQVWAHNDWKKKTKCSRAHPVSNKLTWLSFRY